MPVPGVTVGTALVFTNVRDLVVLATSRSCAGASLFTPIRGGVLFVIVMPLLFGVALGVVAYLSLNLSESLLSSPIDTVDPPLTLNCMSGSPPVAPPVTSCKITFEAAFARFALLITQLRLLPTFPAMRKASSESPVVGNPICNRAVGIFVPSPSRSFVASQNKGKSSLLKLLALVQYAILPAAPLPVKPPLPCGPWNPCGPCDPVAPCTPCVP